MIFHQHRSLRRSWVGLIMALPAFLPAITSAADWHKPPSAKRHKSTPVRRQRPQRIGSRTEIELYKLSPRELRLLETQEMFTIAQRMYQFDESRRAAVYAEVRQLQAERWGGDPETQPYIDLISKRKRAYEKLLSEAKRAGRTAVSANELRRNREFSKILRNIRLFERRHRLRFADALERIEPLLDPAQVEEAHRQWRQRASALRSMIKVRGLFEGLSSKRFKKSATAAAPPKASGPKTAKPRPRPTKPPPGRAGSKPRAARPAPSRRSPQRGRTVARPLGEWERHVREFIKRYKLTPSQTNSALSILKEMKMRAVQVEKANRSAKAAAEKIADARERRRRLSELDKYVDDLFGQLNRRLDNLLTAAQRRKSPTK